MDNASTRGGENRRRRLREASARARWFQWCYVRHRRADCTGTRVYAGPVMAVDDHVSRRDFFKTTVGVGSVATAVAASAKAAAAQGPALVGPGDVAITLTVNGRRHALSVEPRVTLLDALRTRLEITGQKRVCDRGACGACTVIIDGRTYYSCSMLAIEAQGRNIRTVEGIAQGDTLHPVQQAFCDHDASMCGFCTPGFVMSTVALLEKTPNPTPEQAKRALDGNICRCGTNVGLLKAALGATVVRRG